MEAKEDKYIEMDKDITIKCPGHGSFLATPDEHLKGYGCPNCIHEVIIKAVKEWNVYLDYCIEHESNAYDNETSIQADSYSQVIHEMYGKTKKLLDEFQEIRGKNIDNVLKN